MVRRSLGLVDVVVNTPEVDGLPLLTRLILFSANNGDTIDDIHAVALIDPTIIMSEATKLARMGVIAFCEQTGQLTLDKARGQRLWRDFDCVRTFRKGGHRMVFDPLAMAFRWITPSDRVRRIESSPLARHYHSALAKVPEQIITELIAHISPALAHMATEREDGPVEKLSLAATPEGLDATLSIPTAMIQLPHPHTILDRQVWRHVTDQPPPSEGEGWAIDGPALRLPVSIRRSGNRGVETEVYIFDQVTGTIHTEGNVAAYLAPTLGNSSFALSAKHDEDELCEALASSGLLGDLLPERGRRCRETRWAIDPTPITLRRWVSEVTLAECAVRQAKAEGHWHFCTGGQAQGE